MRTIETIQELQEAKRLTAGFNINDDVPVKTTLTGRQLYIQFCYRMSKFDTEFASLEPTVAQTWINIGMARLLHEMEKRFLANGQDAMAFRVFSKYVKYEELLITEEIPYMLYKCDIDTPQRTFKPTGALFKIQAKYSNPGAVLPDGSFSFPKWIPYHIYTDSATHMQMVDGIPFVVDYLELDDVDFRDLDLIVFNSFSLLQNGPRTKFFVSREKAGFPIYVHTGNWRLINQMGLNPGYEPQSYNEELAQPIIDVNMVEPNPLLESKWEITRVECEFYNINKLCDDSFVDCSSKADLQLPEDLHTDIVDYAIDAYFESTFFQSFGKYSQKQARQDMVDPNSGSGVSASRQGKLDAVPPQRYRLR